MRQGLQKIKRKTLQKKRNLQSQRLNSNLLIKLSLQVISNRKKRSASDRSRWQDRANGEPYQDSRESYFED